jgi:precorrin-3B methylase
MLVRPVKMNDGDWAIALSKYSEALQQMLKTDGWKIYDQYMEQEQRRVEDAMQSAKTGDEAMKLIGIHSTVVAMRRFPIKELEGTLLQLQKK